MDSIRRLFDSSCVDCSTDLELSASTSRKVASPFVLSSNRISMSAIRGNQVSRACYRTRAELVKYDFTWIIEGFSLWLLNEKVKKEVEFTSSKQNTRFWRLKLKSLVSNFSLCLVQHAVNPDDVSEISANVSVLSVLLLNSANCIVDQKEFRGTFTNDDNESSQIAEYKSEFVLKGLKTDDMLKIRVKIATGLNFQSAFEEVTEDATQCTAAKLTKAIGSLYSIDPKYSDVVILVEDKEIEAHRCILAARSEVFAAMFKDEMSENACGKVIATVENFDFDTTKALIRFIYTGVVPEELETHLAMNLLRAADKYAMEELEAACEDHLISCINNSTAKEIFVFADTYNVKRLRRKAIELLFLNHWIGTEG